MFAHDILQVGIYLVAIAFLRRVQTEARTAREIALQRTTSAIDEVNEPGSGTGSSRRTSDASRYWRKDPAALQHRKVVGDKRLVNRPRYGIGPLKVQAAR